MTTDKIPLGWLCPRCGRILSPLVQVCPCSVAERPADDAAALRAWAAPLTQYRQEWTETRTDEQV